MGLLDQNGEHLPHTTQFFWRDVPWMPRWPHPDGNGVKPTVRVCFFGVAYDVRQTLPKHKEKIKFKDMINSSQEAVKHLKTEKNCDIVVPLTHQFSHDDCRLAEELGTNVDLILGGHDHTTEYTTVCGHAPYAKAASDLKTQWVMTLWLSHEGQVESVDAKLLSLTDADPFDQETHDRVVQWEEKGEKEMGKRIGCFETPLDTVASRLRSMETNAGDFASDVVREMYHTDVAMLNGGAIRGDKIYDAGDVTQKVIVQLHPFGNKIINIYAKGKELKDYLNEQLNCIETRCGDFIQISGMKYEFDSSAPVGKRLVRLMTLDGNDVEDDKRYTISATKYMLSTSRLNKNELYNMVTKNDAIPLIDALTTAIQAAQTEGKCCDAKIDGRIIDVVKN